MVAGYVPFFVHPTARPAVPRHARPALRPPAQVSWRHGNRGRSRVKLGGAAGQRCERGARIFSVAVGRITHLSLLRHALSPAPGIEPGRAPIRWALAGPPARHEGWWAVTRREISPHGAPAAHRPRRMTPTAATLLSAAATFPAAAKLRRGSHAQPPTAACAKPRKNDVQLFELSSFALFRRACIPPAMVRCPKQNLHLVTLPLHFRIDAIDSPAAEARRAAQQCGPVFMVPEP